jgi:integrase
VLECAKLGCADVAPHDLRRTCDRLEPIQLLLGHASI